MPRRPSPRSTACWRRCPPASGRGSISRAARKGWRPALAARSTPRSSSGSGAINVAEGLGGRGKHRQVPRSSRSWPGNPDAIVTLDRAFFARRGKTRAGWDQVRAVAGNKVYLGPSLPWGWIDAPPSLNRLIGLRWLLPDLLSDRGRHRSARATREFYACSTASSSTMPQLDRLLGGAGRTLTALQRAPSSWPAAVILWRPCCWPSPARALSA